MASTFSSHQQNAFSGIEPPNRRREIEHCTQVYDVFINHRGPDVKHTLATQLYNSLKAQGISSFLDKEEMELGVSFPSAIKTAITSASVLIAIFSKTYAESPWCLAELVFMLQSKAKIIPLFYQVEPWELRYIENGLYAKAFHEYVEKGRPSNWKGIVIAVEKEVKRKKLLHVAKYPVGLPKLVKDFERRCLDELVQDIERQCGMKKSATDKAIVVGIYGKGGVGKTTLSKELFNRKISEYTRASFLFDVRQASASGKLPSLQSKLLKDMFCQEHSFSSSEQGTRCLRDRFERNRSFSFLIVLDGIDHEEQLDALLVKDILNKSGNNLVIITTRNKDVLDTAGIGITYPLEGLDRENGRELFCSQAFGQDHPVRGYGDLVRDFVNICGGLPLSLIVLGQHVYGRDQGFWQDELEKVKNTTPGDVKNILKISIDTLNDEEKQVFMDIACFSIGKSITMAMAMAIWNGSGFGAHHVLQTLKDKCIIEELDLNLLDRSTLRMHDDLRILGREMADKENHPRRRVWRPQDLEPLESTGFRNILAQTKGRCFHSIVDKSIGSAITYFIGGSTITYLLGVPDTSLLWLQIECPSDQPVDLIPDKNSNIFSGIPLKNLQYLIIRNVCFEELWQSDVQGPLNLIELQITNCKNLKTLPATPELCKLAQLKISGCKKLKELMLAPMICLEIITIEKCSQLKRVSGISKLEKLVELEISGCQKLEFDCLCLTSMKFLERITIDGNVQIKCFQLDRCENLRTVKFDCTSIAQLSIHYCEELEMLPDLRGPSCLRLITVDGCGKLKYLSLDGLENLKSVSGKFELTELDIIKCPQLEDLPSLFTLSPLRQIKIDSCEKLQNLRLPATIMESHVQRCRVLRRVAGVGDLKKLRSLTIEQCPMLWELPSLARVSCLEELVIDSCEKLQSITIPKNVRRLTIKRCPWLEELSSLARLSCLERIVIDSCGKLQNTSGIEEFHASEYMRLCYCSNAAIRNCIHKLKSLPSSSVFLIGRAADGAESTIKGNLFGDANIGVDRVVEIGSNKTYPKWSKLTAAVIGCFLIVVDRSTPVDDLNKSFYSFTKLREGKWIITAVECCYGFFDGIEGLLRRYGILKKGIRVMMMEGEDWKTVLHTIVDRLY